MKTIVLKINGMHCVACSMNIDGELEDTNGVVSASTSYAKGECTVKFDPTKVSIETIKKVITSLSYDPQE